MKKELKLRKDETLYDWHVRLADYYHGKKMKYDELKDVLHEVSVNGYNKGSDAMYLTLMNSNNSNNDF